MNPSRIHAPATRALFHVLLILTASSVVQGANLPESRKIDALLASEWEKVPCKPNPPASDEVMVRRLYLDIAGRVPTMEEAREFLQSDDAQKRMKLIDKLLASDGYTSQMFNYWADILRIEDDAKRSKVAAAAYGEDVKRCLKENKPFDEFVRTLITADDGGVWDNGSIGFYLRDENRLDHLAYAVQVFLGTQIICAQCHDHPFDKWTQLDYYGLAAFTYGVSLKGYDDPLMAGGPNAAKGPKKSAKAAASAQGNLDNGDLTQVRQIIIPMLKGSSVRSTEKLPQLPDDYKYEDAKPGQVIQPKVIFGQAPVAEGGRSGRALREQFARWMTSPDNPRFATVIANRLWKKTFGAGLIEPVDEMTDATVASNPALMEYLARLIVEQKYSLKAFLRVLYDTETYQRTASSHEVAPGETYHFTGPLLRRMSAEQIWDSLVTLASGNVDSVTSEQNQYLHQHIGDLKSLMDAVREKGVGGLVEIANRGSGQRETTKAKVAQLRLEAEALKKDNRDEESRSRLEEASRLRKGSKNDFLAAVVGEERARSLRKGYPPKNDDAPPPIDPAALAAMSKPDRKEAINQAALFTLTTRASELHSPERPGHLLRILGQSDREQIQNASAEATVPQALALLNGPVAGELDHPLSKLHEQLAQVNNVRERVDMIYLAFLSRRPTDRERTILDQMIRERGDKAPADLIHALLTGTEFIFIQ